MPEYNEADPIHDAIILDRTDLMEEALESGIDVDWRARGDVTPLMVAAKQGKDAVVERLLKAGAKVNAKQSQ